eukprot:4007376-Heterocapsa_arctica.AAC.1
MPAKSSNRAMRTGVPSPRRSVCGDLACGARLQGEAGLVFGEVRVLAFAEAAGVMALSTLRDLLRALALAKAVGSSA